MVLLAVVRVPNLLPDLEFNVSLLANQGTGLQHWGRFAEAIDQKKIEES